MDIDTSKFPFSPDDDDDDDDESSVSIQNKINLDAMKNVNGEHNVPNSIKFKKVVKLASNVENLWVLPVHDDVQLSAFRPNSTIVQRHAYQLRPHLETSLYLSCGGHGMAIWLSLEHSIRPQYSKRRDLANEDQDQHTYISKRIMLPLSEIGSSIYPLAVRFRDAIVLGAESDLNQPNLSLLSLQKESQLFSQIPFFSVKRTSQVYLHYILRELLRRNLGYRAWEIAKTCSTLPHFVHSLELLLHGVLEEEASSSQPIPDALLPRVVDFIRAFPVFLQTVIHCARKTELALWPHLFSIVGPPKDLFQQCLLEGQLDTASSYIIVLQNLEKPEVASKCASRLLQAARVAGCWTTVKELKRFLRATTADDTEMTIKENDHSKSHGSTKFDSHTEKNEDKSDPVTPTSQSPNSNHGQANALLMNGLEPRNIANKNNKKSAPGAAMKSLDHSKKQDHSEKNYVEENVVMHETTEDCNPKMSTPDDSSLDNTSDEVTGIVTNRRPSTSLQESKHIYCNGSASGNRTTRAYPGTILRMTPDGHINNALKYLKISENTNASSTCSIASSVSSSSTLSSASMSPVVHANSAIRSVAAVSPLANGPFLPPLTIAKDGDREQCTIS